MRKAAKTKHNFLQERGRHMDKFCLKIAKPVNVLKTHNNAGAVIPVDKRYSSVIIIVLCGKMDFVFSDKTIPCDREHAIFIPADSTYYIKCYEPSESLLFNFQPEVQPENAMAIGTPDIDAAIELFRRLEALFAHPNSLKYMILSIYYELFSMFFDKKISADTAENYVVMAENIINSQFGYDCITCNSVAEQINISEVYLRKLFLKYRGISPSRYLLRVRMKKANMYLSEGYTVYETSQNVGYRDVYQFSRAYKKHFGYSPSKRGKN